MILYVNLVTGKFTPILETTTFCDKYAKGKFPLLSVGWPETANAGGYSGFVFI